MTSKASAKVKKGTRPVFTPAPRKTPRGRFDPSPYDGARDTVGLGAGHDFAKIRVGSDPTFKQSCPLGLSSAAYCPFGGICHICPVRVQAKGIIGRSERRPSRLRGAWRGKPDRDPHNPAGSEAVLEIIGGVLGDSGQPLDRATRASMEPRLGIDLGRVRVHKDRKAAESAEALGARAYTVGRDIVFGPGEHAPNTSEGQRLLGHEIAHVIQQRGRPPGSCAALRIGTSGDALEQVADAASEKLVSGRQDTVSLAATPVQVQREEKKPAATCKEGVFYTHLDVVGPDKYFTDGKSISESEYEKGIATEEKKGKCGIKITEEIEITGPNPVITVNFFYRNEPCCRCFKGSLSWDVTVNGKPYKGTRPVAAGGKCSADRCCSVNKSITISTSVLSFKIAGTLTVSGSTYK